MTLVSKKIPGGKLIKLTYKVKDGVLTQFRLNGDFFLYPETSLIEIEAELVGKKPDQVEETINTVLKRYHGEFIGVSPKDIQIVIESEQLEN